MTKTPAQQIGIENCAGPPDTMAAMDEYLFAEIDCFVQPLQRLFEFDQSRSLFVFQRQVVNLEPGILFEDRKRVV